MALDLDRHPCFSVKAKHKFGRVHLPVAPKCNIQCNYCNRLYDCANESRPGVTSIVLSPGQSLAYLDRLMERSDKLTVVGIAGPGDPFANAEKTMETLRLVREKYPEMLLCVATNGLNVGPYIEELAALETSHVTLTINALKPEIGAKIYAWIRDGKKVYRGEEAAQLLIDRQLAAVRRLKELGVTVKINTVIVPGINDEHALEIAETLGGMGADIQNNLGLYPVKDTPFEDIPGPTPKELFALRLKAGDHIEQMRHCARCRADAVGLIHEQMDESTLKLLKEASVLPVKPDQNRQNIAVASMEGMLINQHLGEAPELMIFKPDGKSFRYVESRATPDEGGGDKRWENLAKTVHDCRLILVNGCGPKPMKVLESEGVQVLVVEGLIQEALDTLGRGEQLRSPMREHRCGSRCEGTGTGCG